MLISSALYEKEASGAAQRLCDAAGVSLPIEHDRSFSNFAFFLKKDFANRSAQEQTRALAAVSGLLAPSGPLRRWVSPVLNSALGWSFHQLSAAILVVAAPFPPAPSEPRFEAPDFSPLDGHFWIGILGAKREESDACGQQLLDHGFDLARTHAAFLPYSCASQQPCWGLWALEHGAVPKALWKGRDALWWLHLSSGPDSMFGADAEPARRLTDALLSRGVGSFERSAATPEGMSFLEAILSRRLHWDKQPEAQKALLHLVLAHATREDLRTTALVCEKMTDAPWLAVVQELLRAPIEAQALRIQAFGDSTRAKSAPTGEMAAPRKTARL